MAWKGNKNLADWLSKRYLLIVRDEENFAEKVTVIFNFARLIVFSFMLFSVFFGLNWFLAGSLLRSTEGKSEKEQVFALLEQVNELQEQLQSRDKFLADFQKAIAGESFPLGKTDSGSEQKKPAKPDEKALATLTAEEIEFRKTFENRETVLNSTTKQEDLASLLLFQPVEGVITQAFNRKESHFGVDIAAKKDESVKSVADGTVIMASWTREDGYVIGVQHTSQLVSFYKHNSLLNREIGDVVKAGDVLGTVGNSGENTTGPHLHLELWYNGSPIDPQNFISF
jgi:murein DD-endopeptidase MepM/ murein hydrolase activator NlpD